MLRDPKTGRIVAEDLETRLWNKVRKAGPHDCWEWMAGRDQLGYGMFWESGKTRHATRVIWETQRGKIPEGMVICHSCDNPSCCNPEHLFAGTQKENVADRERKGRHPHLPYENVASGENHPRAKLSNADAREIRCLLRTGERVSSIASQFGISVCTVYRVGKGESYKWA